MKLFSNLTFVALCCAVGVTTATAQVLIGGATENGDFQFNKSNNLITDPIAWGISARNAANTANLALTSAATGRAFISSGTLNETFRPNSWVATRTYYNGGNNAWGFDAGSTVFGTPNVYYFMNSGDATLVHSTIATSLNIGDVATVGFDLFSATIGAVAAPSVKGNIDFGGGQVFSWTAAEGALLTANAVTSFSKNFTLTAPATQAILTLNFTTGRITGGTSSANPTLLDNISLNMTPVPEPATFALAGLGLAALLIFRRRN
jgi:hypothetical protein